MNDEARVDPNPPDCPSFISSSSLRSTRYDMPMEKFDRISSYPAYKVSGIQQSLLWIFPRLLYLFQNKIYWNEKVVLR